MDDLISRDGAIDAVRNYPDDLISQLTAIEDLPSAQPEQRWIPCSERLPEPQAETQRRHWFLTTNAYGNVSVTKYEFKGDYGFVGWGTHRPVDIRIVAWMPLPEPARLEKDND